MREHSGTPPLHPPFPIQITLSHWPAVKGKVVDFSIQNAYVSAIRKAERFMYIENQYFLGSSHAWKEYQGAGKCTHLVPIEIALKIADKIRSGKNSCCCVVLLVRPERDTQSLALGGGGS